MLRLPTSGELEEEASRMVHARTMDIVGESP